MGSNCFADSVGNQDTITVKDKEIAIRCNKKEDRLKHLATSPAERIVTPSINVSVQISSALQNKSDTDGGLTQCGGEGGILTHDHLR